MRKTLLLMILLATTVGMNSPTFATGQPEKPIRGLFRKSGGSLSYQGNGWSLASNGDLGWTSIRIGVSEFAFSSETMGAFCFQHGGRHHHFFPDASNISHDRWVGRTGSVSDGVNIVRLRPDFEKPECELYLGANSEGEEFHVVWYLHPEVVAVRAEGKEHRITEGLALRTLFAELVHQSGAILGIRAHDILANGEATTASRPFQIGRLRLPDGSGTVPAIIFSCKPFAPNSYTLLLSAESLPFAENLQARFDVRNPDDAGRDAGHRLPATDGVWNPIYTPGREPDFGMHLDWRGDKPLTGFAELEIVHALGDLHHKERVPFTIQPGEKIRLQFHPKLRLPGISEVWGWVADHESNLLWVNRYRMAYDIASYKPKILIQPDFGAFWKQTLDELRKIPLEPSAERVFEDFPDWELYHVQFNGWNKHRYHACLFIPKGAKGPLPVHLTSHPAFRGFQVNRGPDGVYGSRIRHDPRFMTLCPIVRGHEPDAPNVPFNPPWWGPLEDRDTYVARGMYTAMVRALDYLETRPDIADMSRVMVTGGSQGGALAIVIAGLDPRVSVCLADCPSNAQPQEILRDYESFGPSRGVIPDGRTLEEIETLLSYYNPVNFAPLIRCETHVGTNIGDITVHSNGPLSIYRNLTALPDNKKFFHPGFTHFHGSGPGLNQAIREWSEKLGGPKPTGK